MIQLTFVVSLTIIGMRCIQIEQIELFFVQGECLLPDSDFAGIEMGSVNFALLAQLCQQLNGFHGVAPLVVTTPEDIKNCFVMVYS